MHGIEQVRLAYAIGPYEAVHLRAQDDFGIPVIAEVQKVQFGEVKGHGNAREVSCVKGGLRQVPENPIFAPRLRDHEPEAYIRKHSGPGP
jgi:hypothetical protein